jgi:transcriptional regulator of acetoin/glycerol metabolism
MENMFLRKEFPRIDLNGLRMNDSLTIIPAYGQKKKIRLKRTLYRFQIGDVENIQLKPSLIELPSVSSSASQVEMRLVALADEKESYENGRFQVRSTNEIPFKLNGQAVYHCFPERGDVLTFGYNQIRFDILSQTDSDEEFPFSQKVCESEIGILIEGETGTGKTRLAGMIHEKSHRTGRFVHLNLSSFSKGLVESELFGHVRGAFTGANNDKAGALLEADRGTLFLDEIDSIPPDLQVKLLLFLDNGMFRQVGGIGMKKTRARVIFASGRNMEELVQGGEIRKDFFFRLKSGVNVDLPPLREDTSKIEILCRDFAEKNSVYIPDDVIEEYKKMDWPGNARQLLGHLEKKKIMLNGKMSWHEMDITLKHTRLESLIPDNIIPMQRWKQNYAIKVLNKFDGNIKRTSDVLQISQNTLRKLVAS